MAREESRPRIIEDGSTGDSLTINPNGSLIGRTSLEQHLCKGTLYAATAVHTFSGTTFENKILLRNPSGSGKNIYFYDLKHLLDLSSSITTLHSLYVAVYRNPTVSSNGATISPRNRKSDASDSAVLLINRDPTITAVGTLIVGDVASNGAQNHINHIVLAPGNSYLLQLAVANSADAAYTILNWGEGDTE